MADDLRAAFESVFGPTDWSAIPTPTARDLERQAHVANGGTLRRGSESAPFVVPRVGRTPSQQAALGFEVTGAHGTYVWTEADQ